MKVADPYLFYFSSIDPEYQGRLEAVSNWMFRPIWVLTGLGREYRPAATSWESRAVVGNSWIRTAISVVAIFPGAVVGTLAKFLAHATDKRMRADEEKVRTYLLFVAPPNNPLEKAHKTAWNLGQKILKLVAGIAESRAGEIWASKDMQAHIKAFKSLLESESELLHQAFINQGREKWESILKGTAECPDLAVTYSVKYSFLVQLYFVIRKGKYYPTDREEPNLEKERRALFFQPETPEFELREVFNTFMNKFEPICQIANDPRLYAKERLDVSDERKPQEFQYFTISYERQLIRQPEIRDAILANQK